MGAMRAGASLVFTTLGGVTLPTTPEQATNASSKAVYAHWGPQFYFTGTYQAASQACLVADGLRYLDYTGPLGSYATLGDSTLYTTLPAGRAITGWSAAGCGEAREGVCRFPSSTFACNPPPSPRPPPPRPPSPPAPKSAQARSCEPPPPPTALALVQLVQLQQLGARRSGNSTLL
jgi:hypothetical protein